MSAERLFFLIFAVSASVGAVAVVFSQNVVRMAFWLIVSLGSAAALFFLMHADFVGATQLLIYVGGTLVLLIFGVMLTASEPFLKIRMSMADLVVAGAIGLMFLGMLTVTVNAVNWDRTVLRQVFVDPEAVNENVERRIAVSGKEVVNSEGETTIEYPQSAIELRQRHEEGLALFDRAFQPTDTNGLYAWSPESDLSRAEEYELLKFLREDGGLAFAPQSAIGGTARPIGLGLLGLRPDRDLGESPLRSLGNGYFIAEAAGTDAAANEDEDPATPPVSVGYLLPFEIVSIHLLVVLVGAAYLARAKRRVNPQ